MSEISEEILLGKVNELRKLTNKKYGKMDCKKALIVNNYDIEKCIEWLKELDNSLFRIF